MTRFESNLLRSCLEGQRLMKIAALKVKCSDESCCFDIGVCMKSGMKIVLLICVYGLHNQAHGLTTLP